MPQFLVITNLDLKTSILSVILTGILSLSYLALSDSAIQLIHYISVNYWLAIGLATLSLFYFRIKRRNDPTYKTKYFILIPIIFLIGSVALIVLSFYKDWKSFLTNLHQFTLMFFSDRCWNCLYRITIFYSCCLAAVVVTNFNVYLQRMQRKIQKSSNCFS